MKSLSTLFFPEPDALNVVTAYNVSYWIMLYVKSDLIQDWRAIYVLGVTVESLMLLSSICLHGRSVFLAWKYKILHSNFLALMTNFYASFTVGSISRVVIVLFESRVIHAETNAVAASLLCILAVFRLNCLAHAMIILSIATIERMAATHFVADYESQPRLYIAIILITTTDMVVLLVCYTIVAGILNCYIALMLAVLPNIGCAWLLRIMSERNRRRHSALSKAMKRGILDEYSLSLRVQLKENIWSMQKIEFGVYICMLLVVVNNLIIFGPVFVLDAPAQLLQLQWCIWAASIILAASIAGSAPIGTFAIALHTGKHPSYVQWYLRKFGKGVQVAARPEVREVDAYFTQLHSQWDSAMGEKTDKSKITIVG